jgi:Icc-related predicted phosphoesterase
MTTVCFISDTHNKHNKLIIPECDFLIHSGDISSMGYEYEIVNFLKWFSKQPAKYKIFTVGNHDWLFERNRSLAKSLIPENVIYLEDESIEIDELNFYGSPVQLNFCNWAFNRSEESLARYWSNIPNNTDILITHSPAYGVLDDVNNNDKHLGSQSLYDSIMNRVKCKISVFGHIHSGHGTKKINNTLFINASNLDENYQVAYNPIIVEIDKLGEIIVIQE